MLVISQLFGLITKTPFTHFVLIQQRATYEIFDMIRDCQIGTPIYNKVKTEQLLKLKIHAIIDTANNNEGYNVLPVLFIYKVLKTLKDKYQIESISIDHLYTYVMTCKSYDEVDDAVEYIKNNAPISAKLVKAFKDFSRVLTVIKTTFLSLSLNKIQYQSILHLTIISIIIFVTKFDLTHFTNSCYEMSIFVFSV